MTQAERDRLVALKEGEEEVDHAEQGAELGIAERVARKPFEYSLQVARRAFRSKCRHPSTQHARHP
ncbi:MAG: hypothetical protein ABSG65_20250 [Bryobacteraceae bacterium]